MTRRLSLWPSNVVSMHRFGGVIFCLRELEKEREKLELGRRARKNLKPSFFHSITYKTITPNSITLGKNLSEWRSTPVSLKDSSGLVT